MEPELKVNKVGRPKLVHVLSDGEILCKNCKRPWKPEGAEDMNLKRGQPKAACRKCRISTKNSYIKRREKAREQIAEGGEFKAPLQPLACKGCNSIWVPSDWSDMNLKSKTFKKFCKGCRNKAKTKNQTPEILPPPTDQCCHLCKKWWTPTTKDWNKGRHAYCVICLRCRASKSKKASLQLGPIAEQQPEVQHEDAQHEDPQQPQADVQQPPEVQQEYRQPQNQHEQNLVDLFEKLGTV